MQFSHQVLRCCFCPEETIHSERQKILSVVNYENVTKCSVCVLGHDLLTFLSVVPSPFRLGKSFYGPNIQSVKTCMLGPPHPQSLGMIKRSEVSWTLTKKLTLLQVEARSRRVRWCWTLKLVQEQGCGAGLEGWTSFASVVSQQRSYGYCLCSPRGNWTYCAPPPPPKYSAKLVLQCSLECAKYITSCS